MQLAELGDSVGARVLGAWVVGARDGTRVGTIVDGRAVGVALGRADAAVGAGVGAHVLSGTHAHVQYHVVMYLPPAHPWPHAQNMYRPSVWSM